MGIRAYRKVGGSPLSVIGKNGPQPAILIILVLPLLPRAPVGAGVPRRPVTGPAIAGGCRRQKCMQAELALIMLMIRLTGILIPPMPGQPVPE